MPTLPMYHPPLPLSGWHRSFASGGHESWSFHVTAGPINLRVTWMDGDESSPQYRAAYKRFQKKPTKFKPPVPRDFPAMALKIELAPNTLSDRIAFPPGSFQGSADEIRIGDNIVRWKGATIHLKLQLPPAKLELLLTLIDQHSYRAVGVLTMRDGVAREIDGQGTWAHKFGVLTS